MTAMIEKATECACGEPLVGRQSTRCSTCTIKESPASSQCPFCLDWYYTHSSRLGSLSIMETHFRKKCIA